MESQNKIAEITTLIEELTVIEASKLVKMLEDRLGVSATAPVAAAAPSAAPQEAAEEKTEFDVILIDSGGNTIAVIKELRSITGLGLKEAKDMAESKGVTVKTALPKKEAEDIKKRLEAAGASVKLA